MGAKYDSNMKYGLEPKPCEWNVATSETADSDVTITPYTTFQFLSDYDVPVGWNFENMIQFT